MRGCKDCRPRQSWRGNSDIRNRIARGLVKGGAINKTLFISRRLPEAVEARAKRDYEVIFNDDDHVFSADELVNMAGRADAFLVTITEKLSADVIARLPERLKIISTFSVGTDHIDDKAAREKGIVVANAPHGVTVATAEIAMALILSSARRLGEGERMVRSASWPGWAPLQLLGQRLDGKRLGIFGLGKIGQALAQRARGFDMEIHYHNRSRLSADKERGAIYHETLDSLLAVSDFFSINVPSTPATIGFFNAQVIEMLPQGAVVVNTARGNAVVDQDLIAALKSGRLSYAGLDVYDGEPDIHPGYLELENAVLLPHLGSAAIEARTETGFQALDNIDALFAGKPVPFPV